jgi:hypothetical protein
MQENSCCKKVIYMGDVQGPEKVNDTCVTTMHAGMMDRGFTVLQSADYCRPTHPENIQIVICCSAIQKLLRAVVFLILCPMH